MPNYLMSFQKTERLRSSVSLGISGDSTISTL